jgi:hypothetical protein
MENLGTFYDRLDYFTAVGNILWPFGLFRSRLVYFSPFWYFVPTKSGNPVCGEALKRKNENSIFCPLRCRVARCFLAQHTKMGKNKTN